MAIIANTIQMQTHLLEYWKEGFLMEKKSLSKTEGAPLYLGLAAAVLLLVSAILKSGVSTAYVNLLLAAQGVATTIGQSTILIGSIIGFIVYPGIFLILLLVSVNKPKRGTTFCVVWIVFSVLGTLGSLYSLIAANAQLKDLSSQLVPGGYYLFSLLSLLGNICVLLSCILLMQRLKKPQEVSSGSTVSQ